MVSIPFDDDASRAAAQRRLGDLGFGVAEQEVVNDGSWAAHPRRLLPRR
jgi:hypothetical protein